MMFKTSALFVALAVVVVAAAEPNQLRSLGKKDCETCTDSLCKGKTEGDYFALCDKAKGYVSCGAGGECYERRCPADTKWEDGDVKACVWKPSALEVPGETDPPAMEIPSTCDGPIGCDNPCAMESYESGDFYHEHCDKRKWYLQCAENGMCYERRCPENTRWDDYDKACVFKPSALGPGDVPSTCIGDYECDNICTGSGDYYLSHCEKVKWYLQCSEGGVCYEMRCGSGTKWDQNDLACVAK